MQKFEEPLRVLVVDDEASYQELARDVVKSVAEDADIQYSASFEEALYLVLNEYFDLIILDLVLHERPEGDIERWEGLWILEELAERGLQDHAAVIVASQFGNLGVVNYLWSQFKIVDFWVKSRDRDSFVAALQQLLRRAKMFGLATGVEFQGDLSWGKLVTNLGGHLRRLSSPVSPTDAELELRHILRRLFSECSIIKISPIETGNSAASVARLLPIFADGSQGAAVIMKYGALEQIAQEPERWKAVFYHVDNHNLTVLEKFAFGRHLGAVAYSLVGARGHMQSFRRFYGEASISDIGKLLDHLFIDTCGLWYDTMNRVQSKSVSLEQMYTQYLGGTRSSISTAFNFKYHEKPLEMAMIDFRGIPGRFAHPVAAYCEGRADFVMDTWTCRTHGDLHPGNILVDSASVDAWLIDFGRSGMGHWARDFVALEAAIRFQHVPAKDLPALFEFEECSIAVTQLGAPSRYVREDQLELTKAARTIDAIRAKAAQLCSGMDPATAMTEYYIALFYQTVNYMRYHALLKNNTRKNHVLLVASLLYGRVSGVLKYSAPASNT